MIHNSLIKIVLTGSFFLGSFAYANDEKMENRDDTLYIYGLPYISEIANSYIEELVIQKLTGLISIPYVDNERTKKLLSESFRTMSEVVLRAIKQPAQDRTQSYFQKFLGGSVHESK